MGESGGLELHRGADRDACFHGKSTETREGRVMGWLADSNQDPTMDGGPHEAGGTVLKREGETKTGIQTNQNLPEVMTTRSGRK